MKRFNQIGMSLIEVLVAISILSVISIGVMTLSKNMTKTSRTATKSFDMETVVREIQAMMNNKDICSMTVFGIPATPGATTPISGIKVINRSGVMSLHPRLKASTAASPTYVAPGMIINGMALRHVSHNPSGATYELLITFMKSVRANSSAVASDMTYGQNITTRKISIEVDNCTRRVSVGGTVEMANGMCTGNGGIPTGAVVSLYSDAPASLNAQGVTDNIFFTACRWCHPTDTSRTTVAGCI